MLNFHTVVLERLKDFSTDFDTEPFEVGWAREAIFFIRVHSIDGEDTRLNSHVQISADGIDWVDEGTKLQGIDRVGTAFMRVSHFGGWLRIRNTIEGSKPSLRLTIQLALK